MSCRVVRSAGCVLALAACFPTPKDQPPPNSAREPAASTPPLAGPDSIARRCRIAIDRAQPPASLASRCAEEFVRRNGYTDVGPSPDSTSWATETFELPWESIAALMRARHNLLESHAAVVCDGLAPADRGFTVVFRYRGDTSGTRGRAVVMGRTYDGMIIMHQDFDLRAVAANPKCSAA